MERLPGSKKIPNSTTGLIFIYFLIINLLIKLKERVKQMRLQFYHEKAILIQKIWRGYYSRKYVFNYYKRKAYLQAIEQKNEIVL